MVEIASVLSRERELVKTFFTNVANKIKFFEGLSSPDEQINLIIEYLIQIFRIKILRDSILDFIIINDEKVDIFPIFKLSIVNSRRFQLRTLDQIHISTALFNYKINEIDIDYFVTSDLNFLYKRRQIQPLTKITLISLESFCELEL